MNSAIALPFSKRARPVSEAGVRPVPPVAAKRLALVLLATLAVATAALLALLAATGMVLAAEFAKFMALAAAVAALGGYCHWRGLDWRLRDSALAVAFAIASLLLCGLVSSIGLRLGLPLADPRLVRGDVAIGFDVRAIVELVAANPWLSDLLHFAYNSSGVLCVLAIAWNVASRDRVRLWQAVVTIGTAMQVTALVSILFPARGAATWLGLNALQGHGLPVGAGTYFADAFAFFYSGSDPLITLEHMSGIVAFPSFHTVMALVIIQGFVGTPMRWLAVPWSALVIVSTIPMGGHYVVDLAGGLAVWISAFYVAQWASGPRLR